MGIGGCVDEQLESNRKLGGAGCLIRKKEEVENCANWLLRKSRRVCRKMTSNSKPYFLLSRISPTRYFSISGLKFLKLKGEPSSVRSRSTLE
jgi:hypothetical protein